MLKKILIVAAMSALSTAAFADYYARAEAKQVVELKDGSTVFVFNDGKMAMETPFGRATRMNPGTVMEGKDGQKITMVGDEVARLDTLLRKDYGNSRGK
jgi:hypothetical protein